MRLVQRIEKLEALHPDPLQQLAEALEADGPESAGRFVEYLRERASEAVLRATDAERERLANGDDSFLEQSDREHVRLALALKVWELSEVSRESACYAAESNS